MPAIDIADFEELDIESCNSSNNDDKVNVTATLTEEEDQISSREESFFIRNILADDLCPRYFSVERMRGFKFIMLTIFLIICFHPLVRLLDLEHDKRYSLHDFFSFDSAAIIMDSIVFATLGRVLEKRGIDNYLFLVPMILSTCATMALSEVEFFQHSISSSSMSKWPWELHLCAALILGVIVAIVTMHIYHAIEDGTFLSKTVEIVFLILCFLLPSALQDSFHLHHYYYFWLLGMLFSRDDWWSQVFQAICWGQYIHGISCFGRDHVLTCSYAAFVERGSQY